MDANVEFNQKPCGQVRHDPLRLPRVVYLANATLLICHEIDSAYWSEWELFHIPGGATMFVAVHLPLIALVLWGQVLMTCGDRAWRWCSLSLGFVGTCGGLLHVGFLMSGSKRFSTGFSISLIAAFLLVSIAQLIVTRAWWRTAMFADSRLMWPTKTKARGDCTKAEK